MVIVTKFEILMLDLSHHLGHHFVHVARQSDAQREYKAQQFPQGLFFPRLFAREILLLLSLVCRFLKII